MMLRVVYMAHMCLPQRILGRVRVKVKILGLRWAWRCYDGTR